MALSKAEKLFILYKIRKEVMELNTDCDIIGTNTIALANEHGYAFENYTPIFTQLLGIAYKAQYPVVKTIIETCRHLAGEKRPKPSSAGVFFLRLIFQDYDDERILRETTGGTQLPPPVSLEKVKQENPSVFWNRSIVISWAVVDLLLKLNSRAKPWAEEEGFRLWKENSDLMT